MTDETPLCKLAYKYGVDKCPLIKHNYTQFYYEIFKQRRRSTKKILEIGIGHEKIMAHVSKIKGRYIMGASLYMWRDFFPNAEVFGADINYELIFEDERIKTYWCDQRNKGNLEKLVEIIGTDIDIVIDDGSHKWSDQLFTCQTLMRTINKNAIYIIEDVRLPDRVLEGLSSYYDCLIPDFPRKYNDDRLIVVKNKS